MLGVFNYLSGGWVASGRVHLKANFKQWMLQFLSHGGWGKKDATNIGQRLMVLLQNCHG